MADFSQSPLDFLLANQQKGYVGIHIEQGVPMLDRDLNLLHDLLSATVRSVIARYVGNGAPAGADGFAIQALQAGQNSQDFQIAAGDGGPGTALVGGLEVTIPAAVTYKSQAGLPALTTPTTTQPDPRIDLVYLDVSLAEIDGTVDTDLTNSQDVGVQTSVRLKPTWVVRVAEGVQIPAAPAGHTFYALARLSRPRGQDTITATMITDLRQRRLTASDMEQRLALLEKVLLLPAFPASGTQFVPHSGVIGQVITILGSNLNVGSPTVRFGDVAATIVGVPTATQLAARVPGGLTPSGTTTTVKITVANAGGSITSVDNFAVLASPVLLDPGSQFAPNHGVPDTQVTINGFNFNAGSAQVKFANTVATLVGTPTNTAIVARVPSGLVPTGQTSADVAITVTTSAGAVVSDDLFHAEISVPAPTFDSPAFVPSSGAAGQNITLRGFNFNFPPVSVKFGTVTANIVGSPSATQIVAAVPSGIAGTSVKITVTTAGGSVTSTGNFAGV